MSEDTAEDLKEETTETDEVTNPDDEQELEAEQDAGEGEGEDSEAKDKDGDEPGEVELVREVKGSQPTSKTRSFSNRIKKFKGETQQEKDRADGAESENAILREQLKLKDIALEQAKNQKPPVTRPNRDDFDEGGDDPKYLAQLDGYYKDQAQTIVDHQLAEYAKTNTQTLADNTQEDKLDKVLLAYHEKASEVCPKDHEEKEDEAIKALGNKTVNDIICNWDDAPLILYYLGSNKDEAESLRDLIARNPVRGVAKIERLLTEISFKPKTKTTAPEPDDELPGGSSSGKKRGPPGAKFY